MWGGGEIHGGEPQILSFPDFDIFSFLGFGSFLDFALVSKIYWILQILHKNQTLWILVISTGK